MVAVILTNYDVQLENNEKGSPLLNMTKPTLGVMDPAGDGDIILKIPPRPAKINSRWNMRTISTHGTSMLLISSYRRTGSYVVVSALRALLGIGPLLWYLYTMYEYR